MIANKNQDKLLSTSAEQTQKFAQDFAKKLTGNQILALDGELGSGKTTFVQGLAKGLNIDDNITSPTFVIYKKYKTQNKKIKNFYHFDLYRIQDPQEILDLGFEEIINDPNSIIAIEWSEKIKDILPQNTIHINFEYINKDSRKIKIT